MPEADGSLSTGGASMSMSMVMTFGKWSDYKLQLLFTSWDIKTKGQFIATWLFVVFGVVCWHGLKYLLTTFVEGSIRHHVMNTKTDTEYAKSGSPQGLTVSTKSDSSRLLLLEGKTSTTWKRLLILRVVHAFIAACIYGLTLLLMLVSMTYNCGLFLALVVGYFLGDLLFFMLGLHNSYANIQGHECH